VSARRNRPPARRDERGECMHLYLTRDATCVHCGMKFGLAWTADRKWLTRPLQRNLLMGIGGFLLMGATTALQVPVVPLLFLFAGAYFFVRALLGTLEAFLKHRFVPGKLGALVPRAPYNLAAMKPAVAWVGTVKFPMDETVYRQFNPGDTLLIEHLRWSRIPVAIYRGHLP
jgi:hypothetical protein